jgi:tetratricopeptide (TPR) repeat protein
MVIVREGAGYGGYTDRYCDLRVDDHENPIAELRRIFDMWKEWALILEGYRLCEAEAWEEAIAVGQKAVDLNPEKGEPYYHLGCYYSKAGRRDEALRELRRAVELEAALAPRATKDPDFKPLYEDEEFLEITQH